jgi:hypothetical protein
MASLMPLRPFPQLHGAYNDNCFIDCLIKYSSKRATHVQMLELQKNTLYLAKPYLLYMVLAFATMTHLLNIAL